MVPRIAIPFQILLLLLIIMGCPDPEPPVTPSAPPAPVDPTDRQKERHAMVRRQIAGGGIDDETVLDAMRKVQRHRLIPKSVRNAAYADTPLGIGYNQTISQPFMVGLMTEALDLEPGDRVLEIGTGSGYQAAVLAEICKDVYTIEIVEPLARRARKGLDTLGYTNIHTRVGDGYFGWKEKAPFDGIIVTAAAGHVPPPLIEQLADGGKIVIPLGNPLRVQTLTILEKKGEKVEATYSTQCRFVPMTGTMEDR